MTAGKQHLQGRITRVSIEGFRSLAAVLLDLQENERARYKQLENIIVADLKEGATSLRNLPKEQYQQWLDDDYLVSDIWLKTPVGTTP